ncbi:3-hydroxyacyl-CoA dehydrogenase NAD-binding domain-containing protein [Effusibacillus consociatus]|uniref:3-hydroxyacyl-CoA dehydrogenase NAD-binding domain-containing protein n=1 Tax=Effusibacillus consociatus TaxID=1117041 RepID=A0ABV9Q2V2_9BACL
MELITTVGVVGSGTMGAGIAQVVAQNGFHVVLYDIKEEIVERALSGIFARVQRLFEKGKLSRDEYDALKARLQTTATLADMSSCQLVIEAAPEKMEIKKEIIQQLDQHCPENTILATNTSSFSVTEIGSVSKRPDRVAGMHFFNPVPLMPLVEIIKGIRTEDKTIDILVQFALALDKHPVTCQDTPGFIVNRVARPFYNEALRIKGDRVASVEQIDRIMKKAGKFRMGPFELQDLIGIDINFSTTESVHQGFFGEDRFRPHFYQQRMMQSGKLGRKVGGGYYDYEQ